MLLRIIIEAICFGLLGWAFYRVGRRMAHGPDRHAVMCIIGVVMALLGAVIVQDVLRDSSHALDTGTVGAAVTGAVLITNTITGIAAVFLALAAPPKS